MKLSTHIIQSLVFLCDSSEGQNSQKILVILGESDAASLGARETSKGNVSEKDMFMHASASGRDAQNTPPHLHCANGT